MKVWKRAGFNAHLGPREAPENRAEREPLCQYVLRNPFFATRVTLESPRDNIHFRSRLNSKIHRNFEMLTPVDFLATIAQHIPDKGAQMARNYGLYSNKMRGFARKRGPGIPGIAWRERSTKVRSERVLKPDAGFVSLASLTRKSEERTKDGVPVLSGLGKVSRKLFTKGQTNSANRSLMLLARPVQ